MSTPAYPSDRDLWLLARDRGLDPYPVIFESVPASILYEYAAYLIPGRMSHWSYGKAYHAMKMRYDYGLNKLYEMVINADPSYAFLLDSNSELENTFVRAHVMGHVDFFHHNQCFQGTAADMIDIVSRHAERVRQYEFEFGRDEVERFLDAVLALETHVMPPTPNLTRIDRGEVSRGPLHHSVRSGDWRSESYPRDTSSKVKSDVNREEDLLLFLLTQSRHLTDWQRDVMSMVRDEMIYFWPQMRTKIMNEGWASYWHLTLMRELALSDQDYVDFARLHSQVTQPLMYQINPYALGLAIFQDIEQREGKSGLFLTRTMEDDVSFVRNHLTEEIAQSLHLMLYGPDEDRVVLKSRQFEVVRDQLVRDLVHGGLPVVHVDDGDFNRRGELYLLHRHEGSDLDIHYAEMTLHHVYTLWGRPVHLETRLQDKRLVMSYDGQVSTQVSL